MEALFIFALFAFGLLVRCAKRQSLPQVNPRAYRSYRHDWR